MASLTGRRDVVVMDHGGGVAESWWCCILGKVIGGGLDVEIGEPEEAEEELYLGLRVSDLTRRPCNLRLPSLLSLAILAHFTEYESMMQCNLGTLEAPGRGS